MNWNEKDSSEIFEATFKDFLNKPDSKGEGVELLIQDTPRFIRLAKKYINESHPNIREKLLWLLKQPDMPEQFHEELITALANLVQNKKKSDRRISELRDRNNKLLNDSIRTHLDADSHKQKMYIGAVAAGMATLMFIALQFESVRKQVRQNLGMESLEPDFAESARLSAMPEMSTTMQFKDKVLPIKIELVENMPDDLFDQEISRYIVYIPSSYLEIVMDSGEDHDLLCKKAMEAVMPLDSRLNKENPKAVNDTWTTRERNAETKYGPPVGILVWVQRDK